ncbi:carbohydrate sulfotransferase 4-like [Aricia agestis]|uniref:carbohydrate sulfotransferase 4-like n=1 Tax=Aricia agestis TaxID=91739 RepID=UPI001C2086F4|nr:carbohydrate sulfotransferase 4-like [Aricia agestis]
MLRRVNFYSICIAFGLSVLLILAGSRYTDNNVYRPATESRRNIKNYYRSEDSDEIYVQPIPTNAFDGSPDVEKILEKTRAKIKHELYNYNFNQSNVHNLEDLLLESGGKPVRSIITSTWRSGTTFLGEILNAQPGNYYHYEPLLNYGIIQIRGTPESDKALKTLKKMLHCKYEGMEDYFEYGKTHLHQFSHNTRLWDHCKYKKELCFDADFTSRFCKLFPFQSMKVVRVRLRLMKQLLEDKELNVKVILLIRDPRGVMQSRQHRNFCQPSSDCWKPELLCADMISDYVAAGRLLQKYPKRLMALRYEELALSPNSTTHKLMKFLGLSVSPSINEFLVLHTNVEVAGVSSTFRVSKEVPFRWKNILDFSYVDEIQQKCKEAMELWGYRIADNATHMASKDFDPLDEYSITP